MIDPTEVQSMVLRPHRAARIDLAFLHLPSAAALRHLLACAATRITVAASSNHEVPAANIGVTGAGIRLLSIDHRMFSALPSTFVNGMAAASQRLGDVGASDPEHWYEPFAPRQGPVHAVLIAIAPTRVDDVDDPADPDWRGLGGFVSKYKMERGWWVGTSNEHGTEPFGFKDSISNPVIAGSGHPVTPGNGVWDPKVAEWRPVKTGEAVLGHVDESGAVAGHADAAQIERDGSYLVIRKLEQHVDAFRAACEKWGLANQIDPDEVAAQMVGRQKGGQFPRQPGDAPVTNDLLYRQGDPWAMGVAPSSHIRRSNPRDDLEHAEKVVRRHMLFRRAIPYDDPALQSDGWLPERLAAKGLIFMTVGADLRRQFEFVQSHWLNDGNRFGFGPEPDPLTGQRSGPLGESQGIDIGRDPADRTVDPRTWDASIAGPHNERIRCRGLPSFVTTRGGAYVLLPSRSALLRLADRRLSR